MRNCITHHHACDCREEKFKKLEAALAEVRKGLELLAYDLGDWEEMAHLSHTTLAAIDATLSEDERKEEG